MVLNLRSKVPLKLAIPILISHYGITNTPVPAYDWFFFWKGRIWRQIAAPALLGFSLSLRKHNWLRQFAILLAPSPSRRSSWYSGPILRSQVCYLSSSTGIVSRTLVLLVYDRQLIIRTCVAFFKVLILVRNVIAHRHWLLAQTCPIYCRYHWRVCRNSWSHPSRHCYRSVEYLRTV